MAITEKRPAVKYTVGAQYICFNEKDFDSTKYEADVAKMPTVVNIEVSDNSDSYESYASGDVYDSDTIISYKEISVEQLAFDDITLAKMRGDVVSGGVILSGGVRQRPFFAYGVPIKKKDGTMDLRWYPKCKLAENTDTTATSTDSHSDQTDTLTIRAYGFDAGQNKDISCLTGEDGYDKVTEDKFFAAPLLTVAAVDALKTTSP